MTDTPAVPEKLSYMIGADRVSLVLNGRWRSYLLASAQGKKLVELLKAAPQDIDAIGELADIQTWINKQSHGRVTVDDCDRLRLDGKPIDYGLTGRITQIIEQGVSFESLANFVERLDRNPDPTVKEDLYRFMEKGSLPLDPDGYVLGFKSVGADYLSIHSGVEDVTIWEQGAEEPTVMKGRIRYPVGCRVEMKREDCDPNRNRTCSRGLHVCSFEYLRFIGGQKLLIVRVDPEHVTAIPADHNDQKLRCCQLTVVAEIPQEDAAHHFKAIVDTRYMPEAPPEPEGAPTADEDGVITDSAGEPESVRLTLIPPEDGAEALTAADWAKKGYEDGEAAGNSDLTNGYEYSPEFDVPEMLIEGGDDQARAAYCKAFIEGYDAGFRAPPASVPDDE